MLFQLGRIIFFVSFLSFILPSVARAESTLEMDPVVITASIVTSGYEASDFVITPAANSNLGDVGAESGSSSQEKADDRMGGNQNATFQP